MTNRCTAFASACLLSGAVALTIVAIGLLAGGEFVLSFETEFKLSLLESFLKTQNIGNQLRVPLTFGIELTMNKEPAVFTGIDNMDQMANRRTAKMRTISRMSAAVFVTRIKTKLHSHSPKGMTNHYQKLTTQRYSNLTKNEVSELNSYMPMQGQYWTCPGFPPCPGFSPQPPNLKNANTKLGLPQDWESHPVWTQGNE